MNSICSAYPLPFVGTFSEPYDDYSSQSNVDGAPLAASSVINSQTSVITHSTSLPCTVSKRPPKLTHQDDLLTSTSLVQTTRQQTNPKISNDDDTSATYKQQKKQPVKSSNPQSRRQQKKSDNREPQRAVSRDSSTSYQNGFATTTSNEQLDFISKLETDLQRLNQALEKQKTSEIQLRTQLSDLKTLRKDLDDLRAENSSLQIK